MTDWPTCKSTTHVACPGIQANGFEHCLAHLPPDQLGQFLATLKPRADLDARGTTISAALLARLLESVTDNLGHADFGDANFEKAEFRDIENIPRFKAGALTLDRATFARSVRIGEIYADRVSCVGTRFENGVALWVGGGEIDASGTTFGSASSIAGKSAFLEFFDFHGDTHPKLMSLRGTDVSNLVVVDVDLSECRFSGAYRLDQLQLEGRCVFSRPPAGWRWTRRQSLAEEAIFRKWPGTHTMLDRIAPEQVAALYRSLRKAFEDSKNEAGAGDFYYGEMEMRRHAKSTRRAERWILTLYWLLSGYGQRAGRALAAIGVLVTTVFLLLLTVGLPGEPVWTWPRVDQSIRIAMGAVVFREAGQQLTSPGSWTVMIARFLGPVLLALAVLAVRARVKR